MQSSERNAWFVNAGNVFMLSLNTVLCDWSWVQTLCFLLLLGVVALFRINTYKVWLKLEWKLSTTLIPNAHSMKIYLMMMFLPMQAESAKIAKRIKLADAMKMPPPGCRHVYQRKPNRKLGSGLSIRPVYFLNPYTCHVFLSDIIPQVQKRQINFLSSFIIH